MKSKLTAPEKSKVELTESEKKDRDGLLGLVFVAACFIVARGIQHLIHVPLDTVVTRFQPTKQCTEYEQPQGKMTGFWHNA